MAAILKQNGRQMRTCFAEKIIFFVISLAFSTLDVMYAGRNYSIDGLLAMCFYCGISFYIFSLFIFTRD
jgi:hypothetical protein